MGERESAKRMRRKKESEKGLQRRDRQGEGDGHFLGIGCKAFWIREGKLLSA